MMELFASGMNAWNNLSFQDATLAEKHAEPHDLHSFTKSLEGEHIERPVARLSYTIVRHDGALRVAGLGPTAPADVAFLYASAEAANGEVLSASPGACVVQHASLAAWQSGCVPQSWPCAAPVRQTAAFDTGFVILHRDGTVSTLGDPRFEGSLGRDVTAEHPAHAPAAVSDLDGLNDPVARISAGGLSVAALTEGGSLYVWGTPSGGTHRGRQPFKSVGGVPNYLAVDGDKDVRDVALGDSHAIALTTDGCVYVVGENGNGQLGLGRSIGCRAVQEWTRVPFEVKPGFEIASVAAGPKTSFIITSAR